VEVGDRVDDSYDVSYDHSLGRSLRRCHSALSCNSNTPSFPPIDRLAVVGGEAVPHLKIAVLASSPPSRPWAVVRPLGDRRARYLCPGGHGAAPGPYRRSWGACARIEGGLKQTGLCKAILPRLTA